jgi:hypothetical protein
MNMSVTSDTYHINLDVLYPKSSAQDQKMSLKKEEMSTEELDGSVLGQYYKAKRALSREKRTGMKYPALICSSSSPLGIAINLSAHRFAARTWCGDERHFISRLLGLKRKGITLVTYTSEAKSSTWHPLPPSSTIPAFPPLAIVQQLESHNVLTLLTPILTLTV